MSKAAGFRGLAVGVEVGRAWRRVMGAALVFVAGCAHYPINAPLARHDPATGYRIENLTDPGNSSSLLVVLTFSGGGTRAAALAYGVLDHLAQVEIEWETVPGVSRTWPGTRVRVPMVRRSIST